MDDDFHSLSKGVFVIPFRPDPDNAGPSTAPLKKTYAESNRRYEQAYWDYEENRTTEQLDEIATWLEQCAASPLLKCAFTVRRLPVALVQNLSPSVAPLLSSLDARPATVNGRDMTDLAAATRIVAVGFLGEAALAAKKAGRTPIDEVDRWWHGMDKPSPLLVHIQNAQLIPANVLSELIYILHLHDTVPFRLLISIPSIAVFTSTRTFLEPEDISLSILNAGRSKRRGAEVNAILQVASNPAGVPISITGELREELRRDEDMFGGGAPAALKQLKWSLLHHSHNSRLAAISKEEDARWKHGEKLRTIVEALQEGRDAPDQELFAVDSVPDLTSTHNPAPRPSILQAMSKPAAFLPPVWKNGPDEDIMLAEGAEDDDPTPRKSARDNLTSRKRKAPSSSPPPRTARTGADGVDAAAELGQRFKEIEALHALWRSAGKSVNLWDWLEGFKGAMSKDDDEAEHVTNGHADPEAGPSANGASEEDEQAQHATFIRFIEESRMLGLVRARGSRTARRTDEVVKGVLMI